MSDGQRCDDPFLIIAGVAKAGTTSLHQYLADHPDICGSTPKEPFYFLPLEFPRPTRIRHGRDPLNAYLSVFCDYRPGQVRLESSPLYLLVPGVAQVIKRVLPDARIVLALREPVARLISYHRMAVQFGWLPHDLTFEQYVREVMRQRDQPDVSPYYKYPIEEGRYAERVLEWQQVFGKDRVLVIWFDDLEASPLAQVTRICAFAGIDPAFFRHYDFKNVNPGRVVRNQFAFDAYVRMKTFFLSAVPRGTPLRRLLAGIKRRVEGPIYDKLITRPPDGKEPDAATIRLLRNFYAPDVAALKGVVDQPPPWLGKYEH